MKLRLTGTTAGLVVGVALAVTSASALATYLYSRHHFGSLLANARETALTQGELIRAGLEHQMLENDRSLIEQMIKGFASHRQVEHVMLLDRRGELRHSSAPLPPGTDLSLSSATCQACHRHPPEQRAASRVIETANATLLRTVIPVPNRPACFSCHDPTHRINGILIVDLDAGQIRSALNRDLRWMAGGSAALTLVLVVAVAGVVRIAVMRRLLRFETTARLIAAGDLGRRVPEGGGDTIAWLGREFNAMADTMTGLLSDVRAQREQLETVINGIDDGIVVLDLERKVVAANEAFLRRTGRQRDEVLGSSCRDPHSGTCGTGVCPALACLQSGEPQVRICERSSPGGEVIWEEVHASPIRRSSGGIVQVVEVWRDISERRAAEARLAESHRLASLGLLASGFSHELNTPLATVLACVEGIKRSARERCEPEWPRVEESATIARDQLLRCRGITQHFLRLSRGQGSPGNLVDVGPALAAVAQLIEPTARARAVAIRVEEVPASLRVRVNEAELQQVVLNLLLNAVEACASGGQVVVGAAPGSGEPGADHVCIRVVDDGCGISPEVQKRIFEPFFSARRGGTGLGLFLSLEFVRRWGGDIRVRSAQGSGSTFEVVLPVAAPYRLQVVQ
jgi:PAS domain S-box-containing protein